MKISYIQLGRTPLMKAAIFGNYTIVEELFMHKSLDYEAKDDDDNSALLHAASCDQHDVLTLLLTVGCDMRVMNKVCMYICIVTYLYMYT